MSLTLVCLPIWTQWKGKLLGSEDSDFRNGAAIVGSKEDDTGKGTSYPYQSVPPKYGNSTENVSSSEYLRFNSSNTDRLALCKHFSIQLSHLLTEFHLPQDILGLGLVNAGKSCLQVVTQQPQNSPLLLLCILRGLHVAVLDAQGGEHP
ncbi:hypothetical protein mRhiFer1_008357 [Rhinolophus ferrumequinum]|uniref:Uncharacterized protein n=1 Tax=Rhinolophus ferrumequinum TaxID=59479 RepID=A0A7J7VE16_RHIFE|nr:hypothetical protein mRhiFer1_008357 [Rhinolophus ferrumequinum]